MAMRRRLLARLRGKSTGAALSTCRAKGSGKSAPHCAGGHGMTTDGSQHYLVEPFDENAGWKFMKYVRYWA